MPRPLPGAPSNPTAQRRPARAAHHATAATAAGAGAGVSRLLRALKDRDWTICRTADGGQQLLAPDGRDSVVLRGTAADREVLRAALARCRGRRGRHPGGGR